MQPFYLHRNAKIFIVHLMHCAIIALKVQLQQQQLRSHYFVCRCRPYRFSAFACVCVKLLQREYRSRGSDDAEKTYGSFLNYAQSEACAQYKYLESSISFICCPRGLLDNTAKLHAMSGLFELLPDLLINMPIELSIDRTPNALLPTKTKTMKPERVHYSTFWACEGQIQIVLGGM